MVASCQPKCLSNVLRGRLSRTYRINCRTLLLSLLYILNALLFHCLLLSLPLGLLSCYPFSLFALCFRTLFLFLSADLFLLCSSSPLRLLYLLQLSLSFALILLLFPLGSQKSFW